MARLQCPFCDRLCESLTKLNFSVKQIRFFPDQRPAELLFENRKFMLMRDLDASGLRVAGTTSEIAELAIASFRVLLPTKPVAPRSRSLIISPFGRSRCLKRWRLLVFWQSHFGRHKKAREGSARYTFRLSSNTRLACPPCPRPVELTYGRLSRCGADGGLEAMVRDYLGEWHIAKPGAGLRIRPRLCPRRCSPATRRAAAKKLQDFFDLIAEYLPGDYLQVRRRRAFALFGMMMGTPRLARTVPGRRQSGQILEAGIEAALALTEGCGMRRL
jgi:hypothetical protein